MPTRLTLVSELFRDDTEQEVNVRDHLPLTKLIDEIKRRYSLPDSEYAVMVDGADVELDTNLTLEAAGVKAGARLRFGLARSHSSTRKKGAFLASSDGQKFDLVRQPALIGRPNPSQHLTSSMLDVDLTPLDLKKTSSRPHAQIIQREGQYHIESLRDDNPTYVNGKAVLPGTAYPLQPGDKLQFGAVTLEFRLANQ